MIFVVRRCDHILDRPRLDRTLVTRLFPARLSLLAAEVTMAA